MSENNYYSKIFGFSVCMTALFGFANIIKHKTK